MILSSLNIKKNDRNTCAAKSEKTEEEWKCTALYKAHERHLRGRQQPSAEKDHYQSDSSTDSRIYSDPDQAR